MENLSGISGYVASGLLVFVPSFVHGHYSSRPIASGTLAGFPRHAQEPSQSDETSHRDKKSILTATPSLHGIRLRPLADRGSTTIKALLKHRFIMNAHFRSEDFVQPQTKLRLVRMLVRFVVAILSSPKGDQGGWEGGARGL
jgi:hypothetical protein